MVWETMWYCITIMNTSENLPQIDTSDFDKDMEDNLAIVNQPSADQRLKDGAFVTEAASRAASFNAYAQPVAADRTRNNLGWRAATSIGAFAGGVAAVAGLGHLADEAMSARDAFNEDTNTKAVSEFQTNQTRLMQDGLIDGNSVIINVNESENK